LDVLVNNAGIALVSAPTHTVQNLPLIYGTNYIGPFLLTVLLLPTLSAGRGGRVVNLSSVAHRECDHTQLSGNGPLSIPPLSFPAYEASKLALILIGIEINRRYAGKVIAIAANPGYVNSDIYSNAPAKGIVDAVNAVLALNTVQGATTTVHAVCSDELGAKLPDHGIWYLSPYLAPLEPTGAFGFFRVFDMMGPYVGAAPVEPMLPPNAAAAARALWDDSILLIAGTGFVVPL